MTEITRPALRTLGDLVDAPERRIEYRQLSDIEPDPRNPKAHDLATIDRSIGRFGVIDAIVIDGRTGRIIAGHGRREALVQMRDRGETPPEGVRVDDAGEWLVPVAAGWSSRTDSEASAALVALNRTTELGGWVDDALLDILDDLVELGEGSLDGIGFTEEDHAALERLTAYGPAGGGDSSGGRDLDALHEQVGDPTPDDALVSVRLNLTPGTADRLKLLLDDHETHEEAVLSWLL